MAVKAIPDGYGTVTPYLYIKGAADAIDFYKKAFGATEKFRMPMPEGKIGHAELQLGDSVIMLADEAPERDIVGPGGRGGATCSFLIYVEDVDARFNQAVSAGAAVIRPVSNQFYGDRSGTVRDPFGHEWTVAQHVEDVSEEEMNRRMAAMG